VEQAQGLDVDELYFLTFTNSGREQAEEALLDVYTASPERDVKRRVRTLHGAALMSCIKAELIESRGEDAPDEIISLDQEPEVYRDFCESMGLAFDKEEDPLKALELGRDTEPANGNVLFAYEQFLKQNLYDIEDWWKAADATGLTMTRPSSEIPGLLQAWRDFKQENRVWEHDDYVALAVEKELPPGAKVLVIDEFQDLSPAQYALFKVWRDCGEVERIYIAGDGNQSIYGFRGASPRFFAETPAEDRGEKTGRKSYRCPVEVVKVAKGILPTSRLLPNDEFGEAEWHCIEEGFELADRVAELCREAREWFDGEEDAAKVLVLARTVRQAAKAARALERNGVPYSSLSPRRFTTWGLSMPELLQALRSVEKGEAVSMEGARALLRRATEAEAREEAQEAVEENRFTGRNYVGHGSDIAPEVVDEWFPRGKISALDLSERETRALSSALDRKTDITPGEIKVDTIHAAKGLQAPAVLLFNSYTKSLDQRFCEKQSFREEERRVFYVGATRASKYLLVVDGFHGQTWTFPPLSNHLPKGRIEA